MSKNFMNSIKLTKPKRNHFDLTHEVKSSMNMGTLCPMLTLECVPGDSFNISCDALVRFAPLVAPVMHRFDVYMHYFFVPNRLVWPNWELYMTGGDNPGNPVTQTWPYITLPAVTGSQSGTLRDYFGIPPSAAPINVNALPFGAYQLIYNEYYRDQNLIAENPYSIVSGPNSDLALQGIRRRAWEHDYFTSALPTAQKGAAVSLPLAGFNDVPVIQNNASTGWTELQTIPAGTAGAVPRTFKETTTHPAPQPNSLYAKMSDIGVTSTTINDLRKAFRLQEWLEKNARAGTRYVENILAHFGVRSSDKRLNRPEYITGVKSPVVISEVLNTAGTFDPTTPADPASPPQGNMSGHGVSVTSGKYGSYFCEEHGYIMGIMSVMPKSAYMQGLAKHWIKEDRFSHYWPEFASVGEQPIENRELYVDSAAPKGVFGYIPRYAEYRTMPSMATGEMRTSLLHWHMARKFATEPALNQAFIECQIDKRIFAVQSDIHCLYAQILHKISAKRPMPKYATPTF